jgi:hypothetical protein
MKRTKRFEDPSRSARFTPSQEWIEAFDEQCTEELLTRARRFAARRPGSHAYDADDLVYGIVLDTASGKLRWDHTVRLFEVHLYDAIRRRAARAIARAERFPHSSIDIADRDGESSVMAEVDAHLLADAEEATAETVERAEKTESALRQLAVGKPLVTRLLDAFVARATSKEDVMRVARMTSAEYHNARRQLARIVDQLPEDLKPKADRRILAKGA